MVGFIAMVRADLEKVGPKGYIHGWIFVGAPGVGSVVHHPTHGRGVLSHIDEHGHAHVAFDKGTARFEHVDRPGHVGEPKLARRPKAPNPAGAPAASVPSKNAPKPAGAKPRKPGEARRGDLYVTEHTRRDYAAGNNPTDRKEYEVHTVTSVDRNGKVKAGHNLAWSLDGAPYDFTKGRPPTQTWIVPGEHVDAQGVREALLAHTFPGSTTPRSHEDLDELKALIRPHTVAGGATPRPLEETDKAYLDRTLRRIQGAGGVDEQWTALNTELAKPDLRPATRAKLEEIRVANAGRMAARAPAEPKVTPVPVDVAAVADHVQGLEYEGDVRTALAGDVRLKPAELRRVARELGIPLQGSMKDRDEIIHHIARSLAAFGSGDMRSGDRPPSGDGPLHARVMDAVNATADSPIPWKGLAELRAEIGGSRQEQDQALLDLLRQGHIRLIPEENQKTITAGDRAAAINVSGEDKHLVGANRPLVPSSTAPQPETRAPGKPTVREAGQRRWALLSAAEHARAGRDHARAADLHGQLADHIRDTGGGYSIERGDKNRGWVVTLAQPNGGSAAPVQRTSSRVAAEEHMARLVAERETDYRHEAQTDRRFAEGTPGGRGYNDAQRESVATAGRRTGNPYLMLGRHEALSREEYEGLLPEHRADVADAVRRLAERSPGGVADQAAVLLGRWTGPPAPRVHPGGVPLADLKRGDYARITGTDQYGQVTSLEGYVSGPPSTVQVGRRGSRRRVEMLAVSMSETQSGANGWRGQVFTNPDGVTVDPRRTGSADHVAEAARHTAAAADIERRRREMRQFPVAPGGPARSAQLRAGQAMDADAAGHRRQATEHLVAAARAQPPTATPAVVEAARAQEPARLSAAQEVGLHAAATEWARHQREIQAGRGLGQFTKPDHGPTKQATLGSLKRTGLVTSHQEGTNVRYQPTDTGHEHLAAANNDPAHRALNEQVAAAAARYAAADAHERRVSRVGDGAMKQDAANARQVAYKELGALRRERDAHLVDRYAPPPAAVPAAGRLPRGVFVSVSQARGRVEVTTPRNTAWDRTASELGGNLVTVGGVRQWVFPADKEPQVRAALHNHFTEEWELRRQADTAVADHAAVVARAAAQTARAHAARAATAAREQRRSTTPATARQIDHILRLLAMRQRSGEGGGFMTGPTTREGVARLSVADASAYIDSLSGNY
jgi:hypothetical protein